MSADGYLDSPWPAEDGGPQRLQTPLRGAGLSLQPGESLRSTTRRTLMSTMTVLGAPGEVYLLTHSVLRSHVGLPTTARVSRLDPISLATQRRSPALRGGPMWPGGLAVHRNGSLHVVYGNHAHRLDRDCQPLAMRRLPVDEPYNSFVVLANGLLVTKNLSDRTNAWLSVLDPDTLLPAAPDTECPEPSIARLSAIGETVYVVGVRSIFRYHWHDAPKRLVFDDTWRFDYLDGQGQSYGWDVVLDGRHAWFMDNGRHRYRVRMIGAGVSPAPNRLIRVSLDDAADHDRVPISGLAAGSITNPPLYALARRVVVGYDSANRYLRAWRFDVERRTLAPLWDKPEFGCASHLIHYPDSGELVINDYRRDGEEVVVLDIETGDERGRTRIGGITQGVVFPSAGWNRDFYWCSMSRLARVYVQ
ncbi:MAG TPA: hypothetical protein PK359_04365 [Burkholderiaceae bacterium]|nr:hypothetical protein [Burkholderiaceae bacterium]